MVSDRIAICICAWDIGNDNDDDDDRNYYNNKWKGENVCVYLFARYSNTRIILGRKTKRKQHKIVLQICTHSVEFDWIEVWELLYIKLWFIGKWLKWTHQQ